MPEITSTGTAVEFRGCDNLVIAPIIADTATAYTVGTVQVLAPVAEIAKTVENSSETHYYDNVGMITIRAEGTDEVTLTVPALPLPTLATITGKTIDATSGAFIDGESTETYFALGYRLRLTDGTYRYVWRLKGTFNFPDETSATESDGTDTNNQEVVFTGVKTVHQFTNGGRSKAVVSDQRDGMIPDYSTFFTTVQTPDTIGSLGGSDVVTNIVVTPATVSVEVGDTATASANVTPTGAATVVWASSNPSVATVTNGTITGVRAGRAIITASAGTYSANCVVTVTDPE